MLKARHIEISYYHPVLTDACFEAHHGKLTGLIGESGSGKSSLLNRLSLYSYDHDFEYEIDGLNIKELSKHDCLQLLKSKIAYLRQECTFMDNMRIDGNLRMEAKIAGKTLSDERLHQVLKEVELDGKEGLYPAALSGGEKQRLAIALALVKGADILFLDEITSALDEANTQKIIEILQHLAYEDKKLIVLATHDESLIDVLDVVYEIQDEKLIRIKENRQGATSQLLQVPHHRLPLSFYFQMAWARIWKKRMLYLLMLVGGAIAIAIFVFAEIRLIQTRVEFDTLFDDMVVNELFVNNNCFGEAGHVTQFNEANLPFSPEVKDQIVSLEGVMSVYSCRPYKMFDIDPNLIEIKENGLVVQQVEIDPNSDQLKYGLSGNRGWEIFPFYDEQQLEDIAVMNTNQPNGLFIIEDFAKRLGLNIGDDLVFCCDVYIPVTYDVGSTVVRKYGTNNEFVGELGPLTIAGPHYEKIRIEVPISGILPNSYRESGGIGATNLFIYYELRDQYEQEALAQHEPIEGELLMTESAYKVFLDPEVDREEIKPLIKSIDSRIEISDQYLNTLEIQKLSLQSDQMFTYTIAAISGIIAIILLAYSFYHAKDVYKDSFYYNIHGLQLKERRMIALSELGMTWLMFFVISLIGLNYLIVNGMGDYVLNRQVPIVYIYFVLADVLVSGTVAVIVDGQLFRKKYL